MESRLPFTPVVLLALLQLAVVSSPRQATAQGKPPAPPDLPSSNHPPIPRRPGADALGPMHIRGSFPPGSQPEPPAQLKSPRRLAPPVPAPSFAVEDGVIFKPILEEDLYQRPRWKGMFRWDLDQLRAPR